MSTTPGRYHIRVQDHVDDTFAEWLAPLRITNHADGRATLTGLVRDQAELYGLLVKLANLNVTLLTVQRVSTGAELADPLLSTSTFP